MNPNNFVFLSDSIEEQAAFQINNPLHGFLLRSIGEKIVIEKLCEHRNIQLWTYEGDFLSGKLANSLLILKENS